MADTTTYDFFETPELASRTIAETEAAAVGEQYLGAPVAAESLGSQQDQNFLLRSASGDPVGVLKIAHHAFSNAEIAAQDLAARHILAAEPNLRLPIVSPGVGGTERHRIDNADGTASVARILRYLPGGTIGANEYLSPELAAQMGDVAGRVSRALATFEHPGLERALMWDPRLTPGVTRKLLAYVTDEARRQRISNVVARAWAAVEGFADQLVRQPVHLDLTNSNLVCAPSETDVRPRYDGILDFGDLCITWAVGELASTATSVLHHPGSHPASIIPTVKAFHAVRPLSKAEASVLWPLVVLRSAILVLSGIQQGAIDPTNEYAAVALQGEWLMFEAAQSIPSEVMTALILDALDIPDDEVGPLAPRARLVSVPATVLDTAVTAPLWNDGAWLDSDPVPPAARRLLADGARIVVSGHATARVSTSGPLNQGEPPTVPTGCDAWFAEPTELLAPFPGTVHLHDGGLSLSTGEIVLTITADHGDATENVVTGPVSAGTALLTIDAGRHAYIQLRRADAPPVPEFVAPSYAPGWLALTYDPAPLFGLPRTAPAERSDELLARRARLLADVQEHYYTDPPRIERGWRHLLVSNDGRPYLDMVNNVAVIGHSHPRVAAALTRQYELLNTNSRFNYAAIVDFSEKLMARLPAGLDQVFLVNSGSEANDLALRLAMAATGHRHLVAMGEAYHGWTFATDAVSTSIADNPNAIATRPDWIHALEPANSYRGMYRGSWAHRYADDAAEQLRALAARGVRPAAFIAESVYGNAGGMALPDGYLQRVYAEIRALGGLTIADEVQVGYGRLGEWFWGFEQQHVIPDIVTMAKAMGNGYPLGVVVTSAAIAEAYRTQGYFFSSAGGSPASCVVGSTVLDVIADEDLQGNALRLGGHLKERLLALAETHPIIGTVHGSGLYLGVELVRDREALEPASAEAYAICRRMLDLGVVVQPTGDRMCILKVKPPLCIDRAGVDHFVDCLDTVLTEGW